MGWCDHTGDKTGFLTPLQTAFPRQSRWAFLPKRIHQKRQPGKVTPKDGPPTREIESEAEKALLVWEAGVGAGPPPPVLQAPPEGEERRREALRGQGRADSERSLRNVNASGPAPAHGWRPRPTSQAGGRRAAGGAGLWEDAGRSGGSPAARLPPRSRAASSSRLPGCRPRGRGRPPGPAQATST